MKFYIDFVHRQKPVHYIQLLRIMKVFIIIMTTCLLQVSAAGLAQRVTYVQKGATLEQLFKEIRRQTGYNVLWSADKMDHTRKLDLNFKGTPLEKVLRKSLEGQPFVYTIEEKTIVIKAKEPSVIEFAQEEVINFLRQDSLTFKGRVLDVFGQPLLGASVKVKGTRRATFTTKDGNFVIYADANATLQVSYLGYETQELKLRREDAGLLRTFNMKQSSQNLEEIAIVSTGYQDLPKERATGSFEVVTAKQLQHSTSPNLLKRLEGITTSMDFNNPISGNANLSSNGVKRSPLVGLTIRGKNTLAAPGVGADLSNNSGQVLVIVDGIPSPYSIDEINPEDVESINVLKDAAASSIWGQRASNGVIVIKTKKGSYNKPVNVSFNLNVDVSDKIDLFYKRYMSTSDFVDAQIQKYNNNYVLPVAGPTDLFQPQTFLSPVEEIVNDQRLGGLTEAQAKAKLDDLRDNDVRRDLDKYFLRKALIQNYSLAIDGGSQKHTYRLSGGYSNTSNNTMPSSANRYNLNYSTSVKPIEALSLQAIVGYNESNSTDQAGGNRLVGSSFNTGFNPYAELADANGNPLVVPRTYRPKYLQLLNNYYGNRILDMTFKPLEDMNQGYYKLSNRNININLNANYRINPVFSASATYAYTYGQDERTELRGVNSYYAREQINLFTTREDYVEPYTSLPAPLKKILPLGGIYSPELIKYNSQILRGQLNAEKTWHEKHQLNAFVAADITQNASLDRIQQLFGYDEKTLRTSNNIPFGMEYKRLINVDGVSSAIIPFISGSIADFKVRTLSVFSNAAYTYDTRYTLSASIRRDLNSTSGPSTNKGAVPYFSFGGMWNLTNERFYKLAWLPVLQLRATFGYNGNVNVLNPDRPIITSVAAPIFGGNLLPYANVSYVTNSELRPEKSGMLNLSLNFGLKNNRLSGSVEYFVRNTTDLINFAALDPTTGYSSASYNAAHLRSRGTDVTLNSINLQREKFRWISNLTFSYNRVKVIKLLSTTARASALQFLGFDNVEGYELSRMAAYRWAGLDPSTGDPRGYDAAGNILRVTADPSSPDINNLAKIQGVPITSLHYFGSAVPVYYGAFRNTFSYANFSLTAAFQYKLGYYFRKTISDAIRYSTIFSDNILGAAEYANRWKNPGDEKTTNVPSLVFPTSLDRDEFYRMSEVNVLRGDHIRLQEINLSYVFKKSYWFIKNPRIYANVTNLGIIWRANEAGIDPDVNDYPRPRSYGFGLSANF
jgi:TonB-linked SusC/RagA family outer membrane protein